MKGVKTISSAARLVANSINNFGGEEPMKKVLAIVAIYCLVWSTAPASASMNEYTSLSDFNAAALGVTTYNFDASSGSSTVGGVTFSATVESFVLPASFTNYGVDFFSGQYGTPTNNVTATLPSGVTAIGFNYGSYYDANAPVTVTINGHNFNAPATPASTGSATDFVGFTSDTPITSVVFAEQGIVLDITQFEAGSANATPTPIPAAAWLLGSGLMSLVGLRRKNG